jgi:hypothetical protein
VKNRKILLIIVLGLALRILLMPLPGTPDMLTNQLWAASVLDQGISRTYIFTDTDYLTKACLYWRGLPYHSAPVRYHTELGTLDHVPDYPPLSIFAFALSAALARQVQGGRLRTGGVLNACFNLLPVVCALATVLILWRFVEKEKLGQAWPAVAAFWLNPVMILHTPVLGYVDAVFALVGFGSLLALYRRRYTESAILAALGCMIKPQGALVLPVLFLTIWFDRERRLLIRSTLFFALFALLPFIPFIATGRALAAFRGTLQVVSVGFLSSQQANAWWLVSWILPAVLGGGLATLREPVSMYPVAELPRLLSLSFRGISLVLFAGYVVMTLYYLRRELLRGKRLAIFWAGALQIYGFTMLTLYPKENHLYAFFVYALPLLVFSGRVFRKLYWALSAVFALNLFFFDGLGRGTEAAANALRFALGLDLTVVLSLVNVLLFVSIVLAPGWHFPATRNGDAGGESAPTEPPSNPPAAGTGMGGAA